jgi:hypothetical protein
MTQKYPELVTVVRDADAFMPSGYHPNVSVPNHRINLLSPWRLIGKKSIVKFGWRTSNTTSIKEAPALEPAGNKF